MTHRQIATLGLLLLMTALAVMLAVKGLGTSPPAAAEADGPDLPLTDGVIVYYFHGKVRCPTCQCIEAYAREAVEGGFAAELKSGRLRWRVADYQQPGGEHFVDDYQLVAPSVVLVDVRGGRQQDWKSLPEVWQLAADQPALMKFIQDEVQALLDRSGRR